MGKRVQASCLLVISLLFVILSASFMAAEGNSTSSDADKINKAYGCLEDKVKGKCPSLSLEERIFSLLAIGECKEELLSNSKDEECWPKSDCKVKPTAQAILALNGANKDTSRAEEWLLSQNSTPSEIDWFLQIESAEATTCNVDYSGNSYQVSIDAEKKLSSNAGSCLSLYGGDYWFRISPSCYDNEFAISCDKPFLTTLLFKKKTSSTIHVSQKTNSAASEGTTIEKVGSLCFSKGGSCDYEGSLWAALALNSLGKDVSSFMPYLITMADENGKYLPESFSYILTGYEDFRNELLLKQKSNKYWMESGDKFYDTALALYPLQYETPEEKTNAVNWLLESQDNEGCWEGNIRNTAFILYSVWPKDFAVDEEDERVDCESAGYYCMSEINCEGEVLPDYSCSGVFKCCDTPIPLETCEEMGGQVCNSNQACVEGRVEDSPDLDFGEACCLGGFCEDSAPVEEEVSECESYGGVCRTNGCFDDEEESSYSCDFTTDSCCTVKISPKKSYWYVWVLLFLIGLVAIGIVFRDKLRPYWFRLKSKFKGKGSGTGSPAPRRPGFPPPSSRIPLRRRIMPRRIIPPQQTPQNIPRQFRPSVQKKQKSSKELDEVLKKLREMGN